MSAPGTPAKETAARKQSQDTYWLLEGVTLWLLTVLGGLYVAGEENVPEDGAVLMVSNHISYLDPVSIGDASPRRVVFMAKAELFKHSVLRFLLEGVDSFPIRRGESDTSAIKNAIAMLKDDRVVCIFPEGTRADDPSVLGDAEPGAAMLATRTGVPVVPVYVDNSWRMLDRKGRFHRAKVTVAFGQSFTLARGVDRTQAGAELMARIAAVRDALPGLPTRRIWPHWIKKKREGSRAKR